MDLSTEDEEYAEVAPKKTLKLTKTLPPIPSAAGDLA
jgi:hypothetical protein